MRGSRLYKLVHASGLSNPNAPIHLQKSFGEVFVMRVKMFPRISCGALCRWTIATTNTGKGKVFVHQTLFAQDILGQFFLISDGLYWKTAKRN